MLDKHRAHVCEQMLMIPNARIDELHRHWTPVLTCLSAVQGTKKHPSTTRQYGINPLLPDSDLAQIAINTVQA